jgi:hypothetical protein
MKLTTKAQHISAGPDNDHREENAGVVSWSHDVERSASINKKKSGIRNFRLNQFNQFIQGFLPAQVTHFRRNN